jgi:hypothetical protein
MCVRSRLASVAAACLAPAAVLPGTAAADDLDGVLTRWERQAAGARTVEASFTLVRRSPGWDDDLRLEGWARVAPPGKACVQVELTGAARDAAEAAGASALAHRVVCTNEKVYEYDNATRHLYVFPRETPGGGSSWEEASAFLDRGRAAEARVDGRQQACWHDPTTLRAAPRAAYREGSTRGRPAGSGPPDGVEGGRRVMGITLLVALGAVGQFGYHGGPYAYGPVSPFAYGRGFYGPGYGYGFVPLPYYDPAGYYRYYSGTGYYTVPPTYVGGTV